MIPGETGYRWGNRFTLLDRLGNGGAADVWRATNDATGADVALKIPRRGDDEVVARLEREARFGARFPHPHLLRVYDVVWDQGIPALVMEYAPGETLAAKLERCGTLPVQEALTIILPILSALERVHSAGIVHRDIKPENIYLATELDGTITPKLGDFGVARCADDGVLTEPTTVLGTPGYSAPEYHLTLRADARSDLFAVGVVLYQMLVGKHPFGFHPMAVLYSDMLPADVEPKALHAVIERLLKKSPALRYRSAAEVSAALCAAMGMPGRPPRLTAARPVTRSGVRRRRPRPRIDAGARASTLLALAVVLAGIFLALVAWRPPEPVAVEGGRAAVLAHDVATEPRTDLVPVHVPAAPVEPPSPKRKKLRAHVRPAEWSVVDF